MDGTLDNYDAWKPISTPRLDEGSYGTFEAGYFWGYAKEGQGDDWGDVVIQTGRVLHGSGYFNVPLKNEWFIPWNISDGEFLLHFKVRNLMRPRYLATPNFGVAVYPTAGCCIMLCYQFMILYQDGSTGWFFNWEDPNPWGEANCFSQEVFAVRWIYKDDKWQTVTYFPLYHCYCHWTTHDTDWHQLLNTLAMDDLVWHEFTIDLSPYIRDACNYFLEDVFLKDPFVYAIIGMRLYTVKIGIEVIGCDYAAAFDYVKIEITNPQRFGDLDADNDVDIYDIVKVSKVYGKTQWDSDWKTSGAARIDYLLHFDGVINDDDFDIVIRNYGWQG